MSKNLRNKTRKVNHPYEVWYSRSDFGGQPAIFQVLKCYQTPEKEATNPCARRLVAYAGDWEVDAAGHDMYLSELKRRGMLVWTDDGKTPMPEAYCIEQ